MFNKINLDKTLNLFCGVLGSSGMILAMISAADKSWKGAMGMQVAALFVMISSIIFVFISRKND